MGSASSITEIQQRALKFLPTQFIHKPKIADISNSLLENLKKYLNDEYSLIPENEKIGKGGVYIARAVAQAIHYYFEKIEFSSNPEFNQFSVELSNRLFTFQDYDPNNMLIDFAIYYLAEFIKVKPHLFGIIEPFLEKIIDHPNWEVREMSVEFAVNLLQKTPELILPKLMSWIQSPNPNFRRFVAEGIRPKTQIKWLRNPEKNQKIIEILTLLNHDPSEYVRKSVGNNIKDLSKYMPEVVLNVAEKWVKDAGIVVTPDLSSKPKKELGEDCFYVVWTLKQAMRWLQERNPEYHERINKILGTDYVNFFDEKKNRLAKPKKANNEDED